MESWRGLSANVDDAVVGLPHVTKIARKPEGVGTEYRTLSWGGDQDHAATGDPRR